MHQRSESNNIAISPAKFYHKSPDNNPIWHLASTLPVLAAAAWLSLSISD